MVTFVASLIGAAAVFARVTSAIPQNYGDSYGSSSAAPPSYTMSSGSGSYDNSYGSGSSGYGNSYGSSSAYDDSYGSGSASSTYSASPSYSTGSSSYGSGSSNWNNGGYDSCVQQCVAQYGAPSSMNMPPSSTSSGSSGSGVTHTVIVAPTEGVLRYVPFALNASVGDTVKFMWGANNHTVTKSSELAICNKTSDAPFASGEQNQSFVFTQVVNDTNPTFFYCGTPTHCEKGMFGIINPPNAYMEPSSASMMMSSLSSQYPSTQAAMSYAANLTANDAAASSWGANINMSGMPDWAQSYAAENILYTQSFLAMNPETLTSSGDVDLSTVGSGSNPIMLPTDVAAAARANNVDDSTSSAYPSASSTASGASAPSASANGDTANNSSTNGAGAVSSPRVVVALVAVVAAFFAL